MNPSTHVTPFGAARLRWRVARWILIAAIAVALRTFTWSDVYAPPGVHLTGDSDALYHVLRAERLITGDAGSVWRDGGLDYPNGAEIPWPPLFDGMLVAAGWVKTGGSVPTRLDIAAAGSVVPVLLALVTLAVVALLARVLVGGRGFEAALALALLPAHATFSMLGRTDQHVLEALLFASLLVPVACAVRTPERGARWTPWALGTLMAIAFWNWTGSAFYALVLLAVVATWFILAAPDDRVSRRLAGDLASGCAIGAILLATSVAYARGPAILLDMRLAGLGGLQPLLLLMTAAFGAMIAALARARAATATRARRAAVVLVAAALPLGAALMLPGFANEVGRGLAALGRSSAWYRSIIEFEPLLGGGWTPLAEDVALAVSLYGLTLVAAPFAAVPLAKRLRDPRERGPAALLLGLGVALLLLGFARRRFGIYLAPALALLIGEVWRSASAAIAARLGAGVAARAGAFVLVGAVLFGPALWDVRRTVNVDRYYDELESLLERAGRLPVAPGRPAILGEWSHGHLLQYVTGRPVVTSPFGTEAGEHAMEDGAAFFLATDEASAEDVVVRRRVGLVVLRNPLDETVFASAFARPGVAPLATIRRSVWDGAQVVLSAQSRAAIPARLFFHDGGPSPHGLVSFRLLDEARPAYDGTAPFKVFGAVPGARLEIRGARRGAVVAASTEVVSTWGRRFRWMTSAGASADGTIELRVPYATGRNGGSEAARYAVEDGAASAVAVVTEADVLLGLTVPVALGAAR